jgi:hypothetical protein
LDTLLVGTILIVSVAFVSLIDKWKKKDKDNYKKSNTVAIILFFLSIAGAILTYSDGRLSKEQSKIDKRQKELSDSALQNQFKKYLELGDSLRVAQEMVKTLQNKTLNKVEHQLEVTQDVLSYSQKLNEAQADLVKLQEELRNQVTGGYDHIPIVMPSIFRKNIIVFAASNYSKYAFRNIFVEISERRSVNPDSLTGDFISREAHRNNHQFQIDLILPKRGTDRFYNYMVEKNDNIIGMSFVVQWPTGSYGGTFDIKRNSDGSIEFKNIKYLKDGKALDIYSRMK